MTFDKKNNATLGEKKNIFIDGYVAQLFKRTPKKHPNLEKDQYKLISNFVKKFDFDNKFFDNFDEIRNDNNEDLTKDLEGYNLYIITESFAKILLEQGRLEEALDVYRKILQNNPKKKISLAEFSS